MIHAMSESTPLPGPEDGARGPMKPLFPLVTVMVLAAVLIYVYVMQSEWNTDIEPTVNPRSGEIQLKDPNPKAGVKDFRNFGWSYRLPLNGHYRVRIKNRDTGETAVDEFETQFPDFEPNVEQMLAMGTSIEIWIGAYSEDGSDPLSETTRALQIDED